MAALETALAAAGGVAAAVATAWLGRKRARGLVKDTDAETLWRELRAELDAVRVDLTAYRSENQTLRDALDDVLEAKLARYEREHPPQGGP